MKNATNVIVLVLSVLLLAGCSQSPSGKATADIEKVTVLFGFSQNVGYSGFYMAQANGYYADEGLSVEFVYLTAGDTEAMKHLAAGNANFMYAGDQGAIMARQDGMGVQEIASIWPKSMFRIAYRDGAIPPFKGQKVLMVAPGSTTEAIVKLFLQQNGMGISDIEPIYAGGQLIPTFVSKQADVTSTFLPQQIITEVMGKEKLSTIKASQFTTLGSVGIYATEDYLAKN
jgi:NitT/TauT family transport system substrate-binding protein